MLRGAGVFISLVTGAGLLASAPASADDEIYSPHERPRAEVHVIDMAAVLEAAPGEFVPLPDERPPLSALDTLDRSAPTADPAHVGSLPPDLVQVGDVVLPRAIVEGGESVSPRATPGWEDIEGNQYPRKGTAYLNFMGAKLAYGTDNSAEDKSTLAKNGDYPPYAGTVSMALAKIQAVEADLAAFGLRVVYEKRPHKTVPYTMAMIGGEWTDTNIDSPAGGVAPTVDCEARNQRRVVYAFGNAGSATISQELAHAWGLDHIFGSDMIMSYQSGGNKSFATECRPLCEEACQGANTIGCREIHEKYCPVGEQWDAAELNFVFGGNEPDTEPPVVEILEPEDGLTLPPGSDISLKGFVSDNYGGVGWKLMIEVDGEIMFDQVDYERILGWDLNGLTEGTYRLILEAEDHNDHIVQDIVTVYVTDGDPPTTGSTGDPTGDGTSGDGTSGDGTSGDGTSGDDSAGSGIGSGSDGETDTGMEDGEGCGCRSRGLDGSPSLLLLTLLLLRRRRS